MEKLLSHYTATGFVLNKNRDKILFIFHKKLQLWLPPGGHVDEGELPHEAVLREVFEETGVRAHIIDPIGVLNLTEDEPEKQMPTPYAIFHEKIPAYGNIAAHLHYDFLYHMQAVEEAIRHAEREVVEAQWFDWQQVQEITTTKGSKIICEKLFKMNQVKL
jgi:8-oxo-dGTP pyrophosphatase MutT (NUDIX family)